MGYLVLLEQIGEAVHGASGPVDQGGIPRALAHFGPTGLQDAWVDALVALRNALAHDYGLVAMNRNAARRHVFRLTGEGPLVRLPDSRWDRDWRAHPERDATYVKVLAVADLVERVIVSVGNAWWSCDLDTDLSGGRDELAARFTFAMLG